jgi:hypothetical protein
MQAGGRGTFMVHILIMENEKGIDLFGKSTVNAGELLTFLHGSINMDTIRFTIWTKMPARSCGRRNCSPRFQLVEVSLAPGKSRTGNHQLPPQIQHRENKKMLIQGSSSSVSGKPEACTHRWGRRRHASGFESGVGDFRGNLYTSRRGWEPDRLIYTWGAL